MIKNKRTTNSRKTKNSFFIEEPTTSRKLKNRVSACARKIPKNTYYIDSNGYLVSEK